LGTLPGFPSQTYTERRSDVKTILSIDGGGIRGIIPARVLAEVESRAGWPTSKLFDYVAGTSTGGILAVGLVRSDAGSGLGPYTAEAMAQLYAKEGASIFSRSPWHRLRSLGSLAGPKYDSRGGARVFRDYFGSAELKDACTRLLVTAYEIESRTPYFFKSWEAEKNRLDKNFYLRDVAAATSAAPTYFSPYRTWPVCDDAGRLGRPRVFVDGGVFANNPAMCAVAEVKKLHPDEELLVVSIGTGNADKPIYYRDSRKWGVAGWAVPLLDTLIDGVSDTVDYQAALMVASGPRPGKYYRFQTDLPREMQEMDDVRPRTISALLAWADRLIERQSSELDEICKLLDPSARVDGGGRA
jgi:patatin-like phospholipase/acyl hydrolase